MIHVDSLWKSYDTLIAVREFGLSVGEGQTMGLIGPNGSGKTTLLRMMTTLAKPDRGSIDICGFDALDKPREVRRRVALMPAEFGFPMDMSIREYMEYFACAAGVKRHARKRIVDEVMELTDLAGRGDVIVRGLSTGNRQRLLLAKTLLSDPEILFLDEPASGLDPRARAEVRALLKELAAMGKTVVISSHILADVEDLCTHICILEEGRHVVSGPISELRSQYASANKVVHLRVPEDRLNEAVSLLAEVPDILQCERDGNEIQAASVRNNCNYILKVLIDADLEILEMREEAPNLEDIFMMSTKGIVS